MGKSSRWVSFAAVLVACTGSSPGIDAYVTPDAYVASDAYVTSDAPEVRDAGLCDCCGTSVVPSGGACNTGVCDPWCGIVDPCVGACDASQLCVRRASVDAGSVSACVTRPSSCASLGNCGGPVPDQPCRATDACFVALSCDPSRVVRRGALVDCR